MKPLLPVIDVNLEGNCTVDAGCNGLAAKMFRQLNVDAYRTPMSTLAIPSSLDFWMAENRTARKRSNACARAGFTAKLIDRSEWEEDVFAINTSAPERQGKPMSKGYRKPLSYSAMPEQPCPRHRISCHGVVAPSGHLVAYLALYRVGDLVLVSQILGHDDYLNNHVMYLLFRDGLAAQIEAGKGWFVYNRHDSGRAGLVWFKERLGLAATTINWQLA